MEENKKDVLGDLEKLALIADSLQVMFRGKTSVVLELSKEEYNRIIKNFREVDRTHIQFSIDISGTEFVFILNEDML